MTDVEFQEVVDEALEGLPPEIAQKIENIEIIVEDTPHPEIQKSMKAGKKDLLGLYTGVPFSKRSPHSYGNVLPDVIYLFKKNLEELCPTRQELVEQIQRTLLHEIGHYFGLTDKRLRELGY